MRSTESTPIKVLFLASDPARDLTRSLASEFEDISARIRNALRMDRLHVVFESATRIDDLQTCLLRHDPHILHFGGHGSDDPAGLPFPGEHHTATCLTAAAASSVLCVFKNKVRLVVLNSCTSEPIAKSIVAHIECVVCMQTDVSNRAAITFAGAFYEAIAYGRSVKDAFSLGLTALEVHQITDGGTPLLLVADGVDASHVILVDEPSSEAIDTVEYSLHLECGFGPEHFLEIIQLLDKIRIVSRDFRLRLGSTEQGSLILHIQGSLAGFEALSQMQRTGNLSTLLGVRVLSVTLRAVSMTQAEAVANLLHSLAPFQNAAVQLGSILAVVTTTDEGRKVSVITLTSTQLAAIKTNPRLLGTPLELLSALESAELARSTPASVEVFPPASVEFKD